MLKPSRIRRQIFLAIMDFLVLVFSVPIALLVRNLDFPNLENIRIHFFYFLPVMLFWIIAMYTAGFYILEKPLSVFRQSIILLLIALISAGFGFSIFYLFSVGKITPKTVLFVYTMTAYILLVLWRSIYAAIYFGLKNYPHVLFIGYNSTVAELLEFIQGKTYFKYEPLAVFSDRPEISAPIKTLHTAAELERFFAQNKVDIVILSTTHYSDINIRRILFSLLNKKVSLFMIQDFYELTTRRLPIDVLNDSWIISKINLNSKNLYLFIKRVADIFISLVSLIVLSPLLLIVAFLIKISSKGPVFFKQTREGRDGKCFTILKFRTMHIDNNDFSPTAAGDSRITKIGGFLRKTRIDEIPQMFNVLKGEMSFIGPRPERVDLSEELDKQIPFYRQRLLVKPGISGWDQVSGEYHSPSVEDTIEKVKHDLYYIKNISLFLDISILFKTITTIVKKAGR